MWDRGTCRNTSREIDEMIGRIMIASTTEAVKSEFLPGLSPPNRGNQPNAALRNRLTTSIYLGRKISPHSPQTKLGTAASRSTTYPSPDDRRLGHENDL